VFFKIIRKITVEFVGKWKFRTKSKMKLNFRSLLFFTTRILVFAGCVAPGSPRSIKAYFFPVSKYELQKAVNAVIFNNSNIAVDKESDSLSKFYNDGIYFKSIKIKTVNELNDYTFQYVGDENSWDTAKKSEISIVYAFDKACDSSGEGDGNIPFYKFKLKHNLISIFEKEFIVKIDSILQKEHNNKGAEISSVVIVNSVLENQVKAFIKSAKIHSASGSNYFTVRFFSAQNDYRVTFDNINPSVCDSFIGYSKFDTIYVYYFGGKKEESFFAINRRVPCETFLRKNGSGAVPAKIDWYSDEFIFNGARFNHLRPH
jgi:hypothetical protein